VVHVFSRITHSHVVFILSSDVTDVAWSPGDRFLASVGLDSAVMVWCGFTLGIPHIPLSLLHSLTSLYQNVYANSTYIKALSRVCVGTLLENSLPLSRMTEV
jgi:WD40 repeat protein